MIAPQALDPPPRMRPPRNLVSDYRFVDGFALAQVTAQHCIDERFRTGPHEFARREHRSIDDGKRRRARVIELIDRNGDERAQQRFGDGLADERAPERVERAPVAQRAIGQFLHERAAAQRAAVIHFGERLANSHATEHAGHRARCEHLLVVHECQPASSKRVPGASARPAANAAAGIGRPAAGCNCVKRSTVFSPHTTSIPAAFTATTVPGPSLDRAPTGIASMIRTAAPRHETVAPGAGDSARIFRSMARAGARQSMARSARSILVAYVTPTAGCGVARTLPITRSSNVSTARRAPTPASRASSVPAVSRSAMSTDSTASIGPVTRPASTCMIVMPVEASPASIARTIGAA